MFVRGIDFAGTEWTPPPVYGLDADGWAMRTPDDFRLGGRPAHRVAGETVQVPGFEDGSYDVYFYRTWRGLYLELDPSDGRGRRALVSRSGLLPRGGRAQNIGNDVAFKIVPKGGKIAAAALVGY